MSALRYLLLTRLKNSLKELRKKPGRVILYTVVIVFIVVSVGGFSQLPPQEDYRNSNELVAITLLLYAGFFIMVTLKGLDAGATFFSMADVNFLFPAPVSASNILFYGLFRQLGMTALTSAFIMYQYGWLHTTYGLTSSGLILLLAGFILTVFCAQLTAMFIYMLTSGNEQAQKRVMAGIVVLCALYLVYLLLPAALSGNFLLDGARQAATPIAGTFPVAGWVTSLVWGLQNGEAARAIVGLALTVAWITFLLLAVIRRETDYYEDVLLATEVSHSALAARKEGNTQDAAPRNVKTGKTGIGKGWGASAIYHKHLLEIRRSGILLLDRSALVIVVFVAIWSYFTSETSLLPAFGMTVYMQLIFSLQGRWIRELDFPYVYLIPQSTYRLLLNMIRVSVLQVAVQSVVIFVVSGFVIGAPPTEILGCIIAGIGFGWLFIAGNVMIRRSIGVSAGKTTFRLLFAFCMAFLSIPGMLAVMLVSDTLRLAGFVGSAVFNLLLGALLLYCNRNMLDDVEVVNR